jgi:FAD/FMN-containing dehydrogenase
MPDRVNRPGDVVVLQNMSPRRLAEPDVLRHVVRCRTPSDVAAALRIIGDRPTTLDLRGLDDIDVRGDLATVGGGVTAQALLDAAARHGLTPVVGRTGSARVAGLVLGGGHGPLIGRAGLSADNLVSAEVVLADGTMLEASQTSGPDLFWALRGGGAPPGVVTSLTTRLQPIARVVQGTLVHPLDGAREVLAGLRWLHQSDDDSLDTRIRFLATRDGVVLVVQPTWSGAPEVAGEHLAAVRALGRPLTDHLQHLTIAEAVSADEAVRDRANRRTTSRLLTAPSRSTDELLLAAATTLPSGGALDVQHVRGAATRVAADATAYPRRTEHLRVEISCSWRYGDGSEQSSWVRSTANLLDRPPPHGADVTRLERVRARYDPDGRFTAISV